MLVGTSYRNSSYTSLYQGRESNILLTSELVFNDKGLRLRSVKGPRAWFVWAYLFLKKAYRNTSEINEIINIILYVT